MEKITIMFFGILFLAYLNAQTLSSYDSNHSRYISDISNAFNNQIKVDELKDEIQDIQSKILYLVKDIKDMGRVSKDSKEYKELLLKAEELESFSRSNNCECLNSFKKIYLNSVLLALN